GGFGGGEVRLNPTQGPVVHPISRGGGDGQAERPGVLALAGVVAAPAVQVAHAPTRHWLASIWAPGARCVPGRRRHRRGGGRRRSRSLGNRRQRPGARAAYRRSSRRAGRGAASLCAQPWATSEGGGEPADALAPAPAPTPASLCARSRFGSEAGRTGTTRCGSK